MNLTPMRKTVLVLVITIFIVAVVTPNLHMCKVGFSEYLVSVKSQRQNVSYTPIEILCVSPIHLVVWYAARQGIHEFESIQLISFLCEFFLHSK